MSKVQEKIREIEEQKLGTSGRSVLLVEGTDDELFFSNVLTKKYPDKKDHWLIAAAGNKTQVLEILQERQKWLGIVDKDEWSQELIKQKQQDIENLWILPRFCIENYLIIPAELWSAFPKKQQKKIPGGQQELEQKLIEDLPKWVAHGVLWSVINPLWEGLRARGFKEDLLSPDIVQNEQAIKEKLREWHDFLEPKKLWGQFSLQLDEAKGFTTEQQLKHWVHGKKFYENVIHPVFNELLGQQSASERKKAIIRTCPVPDDLTGLWEKMGL